MNIGWVITTFDRLNFDLSLPSIRLGGNRINYRSSSRERAVDLFNIGLFFLRRLCVSIRNACLIRFSVEKSFSR